MALDIQDDKFLQVTILSVIEKLWKKKKVYTKQKKQDKENNVIIWYTRIKND